MKQYRYRAVDSTGTLSAGIVTAHRQDDVDQVLHGRGLYPLAVAETSAAHVVVRFTNRRQLAIMLRALASLCESGAPLATAVRATAEIIQHPPMKTALAEVLRLLNEGQRLTDALEHTGLATAVVASMLRAGERGGQLQAALTDAAAHLEYEAAAAARLTKALTYPAVLLVTGFASIGVILFVMVPRFVELLRDAGQSIPLTTTILLRSSEAIRSFGLVFLVGIGVIIGLVYRWIQAEERRAVVHELLLGVPVVGRLRIAWATARFARSLGGLLGTGTPLLTALGAARESVADHGIRKRLDGAIQRITGGGRVASELAAAAVVTPSAAALIGIGESSGRLSEMTLRAGDLAAQEAERMIDEMITLVEPCLVLIFGSIVALVAAAMFQAVYSLRPAV